MNTYSSYFLYILFYAIAYILQSSSVNISASFSYSGAAAASSADASTASRPPSPDSFFVYHDVKYLRAIHPLSDTERTYFLPNGAYESLTTFWGCRAYPFINKSLYGGYVPPCPHRDKLSHIYCEVSRCVRGRALDSPESIIITLKSLGLTHSLDQSLWVVALNMARNDLLGLMTMYPELEISPLSSDLLGRVIQAQLDWCVFDAPLSHTLPECSLTKMHELMRQKDAGTLFFHPMTWSVSLFQKAFHALPCVRGDPWGDEHYTSWSMRFDACKASDPPHQQISDYLEKLAEGSPAYRLIRIMFAKCPGTWNPSKQTLAFESIFSVFEHLKPPPEQHNSIEFFVCVKIFSILKILSYNIHGYDVDLITHGIGQHILIPKPYTHFEEFVRKMHASTTADPGALSFVIRAMEHAGIPVVGTSSNPLVGDDVREILDALPGYHPTGQRPRWISAPAVPSKSADTSREASAAAAGAGGNSRHAHLSLSPW